MNIFIRKFLVLFFIALVISITPGFAVKVGETVNYNDTEKILSDIDKESNNAEILLNEGKYHVNAIGESLNFIMSNCWNFWKYKQIKREINQINIELNGLKDLPNQINVVAGNIASDSIKLDKSLNEVKFNNSYGEKQFLKELELRINTTFDINDPINFKQGDIVQYKSQKGNYNYLEFVKIDNTTNYVILLNNANKKIALSQEFFNKTATLKISPKTPNHQIINTIKTLQQENINTTKDNTLKTNQTAQKMKESGRNLEETGGALIALCGVCVTVGFIINVIAFLIPVLEPLALIAAILLVIGVLSFVAAIGFIIYGGHLISNSKELITKANKDLIEANALESDLNESLNSFPFAANMNLTTPAGVSVNGTFNGTDFDVNNLTYTIVEQPKHGILNASENGSFKYTSYNNFTGNDSFKYKVNDGSVDSNIATVNITVLPNTTKIIMSDIKGKVGDRVNITATLQNNLGKGIANATVIFKINNTIIGNATTNEKGIAILNYVLKYKGNFTLLATFLGNPLYATSNNKSILKIEPKK